MEPARLKLVLLCLSGLLAGGFVALLAWAVSPNAPAFFSSGLASPPPPPTTYSPPPPTGSIKSGKGAKRGAGKGLGLNKPRAGKAGGTRISGGKLGVKATGGVAAKAGIKAGVKAGVKGGSHGAKGGGHAKQGKQMLGAGGGRGNVRKGGARIKAMQGSKAEATLPQVDGQR